MGILQNTKVCIHLPLPNLSISLILRFALLLSFAVTAIPLHAETLILSDIKVPTQGAGIAYTELIYNEAANEFLSIYGLKDECFIHCRYQLFAYLVDGTTGQIKSSRISISDDSAIGGYPTVAVNPLNGV